MGIYKAKTIEEVYKLKALHKDVSALSGRTEPEKTQFIAEGVASKLEFTKGTILIDVGCGDGTFLEYALEKGVNPFEGRLIGLLPNIEEVLRVTEHLATNAKSKYISVVRSDARRTNLPENYADILVCNGVLHGTGMTLNYVKSSLLEFYRVLSHTRKDGVSSEGIVGKGLLYIGEMPDSNELVSRQYGDSVIKWLFWVLRNQGFRELVDRLKQVLSALFGSEPFIITPKFHFHATPEEFTALLTECGFTSVSYWKCIELDRSGGKQESETRWNYMAFKA
jgi:ubiquinone/menaquinone biosynthesis C-methylase UbiE